MIDRIIFFLNRMGERLWVKPLVFCFFSILAALLAKVIDSEHLGNFAPDVSAASIETLLATISSSMLVIATFAVGSMVAAYSSASSTATPRSFPLVIADDVSQNALSTFIGAFIFSIVAQIALENHIYERAGQFVLFIITLGVFVTVIITFVRWVDKIARLGRLGETIAKVEAATAASLMRRKYRPTLQGIAADDAPLDAIAVYSETVGYVQRVDVASLQSYAEKFDLQIHVAALPGTFATPGRALSYLSIGECSKDKIDITGVARAFVIGEVRLFDEDPRFGLIALSEIADRALSPAVNDPGSAIGIIGSFVRLFALWTAPVDEKDLKEIKYDRVAVPRLAIADMFDDAFTAIARDGAGMVEVGVRLQKAFATLSLSGDIETRKAATHHSSLALQRAETILKIPHDKMIVQKAAELVHVA